MATKVNGLIQKVNPGNNTQYSIASTAYGYCETAAATAAKVVDMTGFTLLEGTTIHVKLKENNTTASPTLNVNGTGAKPIVQYGTTAAGTSSSTTGWYAGAVVSFTYDGTSWVRDQGFNTNTTYTLVGLMGSTAIGSSTKPVYWNGSNFTGISSYEGNAATATTATNLSAAPSLTADGNSIKVTTGGKTSSAFTVPYATNAGAATKLAISRNLKVKLDSSTAVTFDGSANQEAIPVTGTLPVANGGTGMITATNKNAVVIGNSSTVTDAMQTVRTASGAFYATAQDAKPAFGTLPVAQGGTGQTSIANIQAGKDSDGNTINTTYVRKSGDTMTGDLIIDDALQQINSPGRASLKYVHTGFATSTAGNTCGISFNTTTTSGSNSTYTPVTVSNAGYFLFSIPCLKNGTASSTRFVFYQKSIKSADATGTNYYEVYSLPRTTNDLTANASYNILTTKLHFVDKTVATNAWSADSTYSGFSWKADIACDGVTATHVPNVIFDYDELISGNFCPFADSSADIVTIYCKTKPSGTITIPTIYCT